MNFDTLDEHNVMMYALKHYDSVQCNNMSEFMNDFKMIPMYLKRLFNKYKEGGEIKERLILNHLVIFYNMFGPEAGTRLLFYKIDKTHWPILKTFLIYLKRCPDIVNGHNLTEVTVDNHIANILRGI